MLAPALLNVYILDFDSDHPMMMDNTSNRNRVTPEEIDPGEIDPIEEADRLACLAVKGRQYWSIHRKVVTRGMSSEDCIVE